MAKKLLRRRGEETVAFYTQISPEVDNTVKRLMSELQLPQWAVIELAIKNLQYDEHGVPVGWDIPAPNNKELPITAA